MSKHITPLEVAEATIAPIEELAVLCGLNAKAAYGWRRETKHRAAGDFPSANIIRQIYDHARARGIPLELRHLIYGASQDELAGLTGAPAPAPLPEQTAAA
ncbi:MAG: hypothetical protein AAFO97_15120 [Pseudomonadota bacterium]